MEVARRVAQAADLVALDRHGGNRAQGEADVHEGDALISGAVTLALGERRAGEASGCAAPATDGEGNASGLLDRAPAGTAERNPA